MSFYYNSKGGGERGGIELLNMLELTILRKHQIITEIDGEISDATDINWLRYPYYILDVSYIIALEPYSFNTDWTEITLKDGNKFVVEEKMESLHKRIVKELNKAVPVTFKMS